MDSLNCGNRKGLSDEARAVTKYTPEVTQEHKKTGAGKVFASLGDIRLYECPLTYITAETWEVIRLAYMTESTGHLYFRGGLADQPFWLIEAIEICKAEERREQDKLDAK